VPKRKLGRVTAPAAGCHLEADDCAAAVGAGLGDGLAAGMDIVWLCAAAVRTRVAAKEKRAMRGCIVGSRSLRFEDSFFVWKSQSGMKGMEIVNDLVGRRSSAVTSNRW